MAWDFAFVRSFTLRCGEEFEEDVGFEGIEGGVGFEGIERGICESVEGRIGEGAIGVEIVEGIVGGESVDRDIRVLAA